MRNRSFIVSAILIVIAFFAGVFMASYIYKVAISEMKNGMQEEEREVGQVVSEKLNWGDAFVAIRNISEIINNGHTVYSIEIEVPETKEIIPLEISYIEYKVLKRDDEVKIHYIINEETGALDHIRLLRDMKGRIETSINETIVVIDPGHGGISLGQGSNDLWVEKDLNLKMSLVMKDYLEEAGIRVILTRDKDEYVSLVDRGDIANYVETDLLISNHLNKLNGKVKGTEIIYSSKSDVDFANKLADSIAQSGISINRVFSRKSEAIPELDYYFLHREIKSSSYIIEYGFADNEEDAEIISKKWEDMVEGVSKDIIQYINTGEIGEIKGQPLDIISQEGISQYLPAENLVLTYNGGFEGSGYTITVNHIEGNLIQVSEESTAARVVKIYRANDGKIVEIFNKEAYDGEINLLGEEENRNELVIKGPIEVGNIWKSTDGDTNTITGIDVKVTTPAGTFMTLEIVREGENSMTKKYYAVGIGLVKSEFVYQQGDPYVSELIEIK